MTDELDFRREHFAAAGTPLVFSPEDHRPAIFRGLVAFEYVRGIERDMHGQGKLMMANGAPDRLWWLAPMLDVLGTETDWNRGGKWQPMSDAEIALPPRDVQGQAVLLFDEHPLRGLLARAGREIHEALPGLRDVSGLLQPQRLAGPILHAAGPLQPRPAAVQKICAAVQAGAEAGWEPITQAHSNDEHVYVERFGSRHFTVFNDSPQRRTVTITLEGRDPTASRELLSGRAIEWRDGQTTLSLEGEDVAVIETQ